MFSREFTDMYEVLYRGANKKARKDAKKKWQNCLDYHKAHGEDELAAHAAQMLAIIEYVDLTS